jgi:HD superfamily phosphodiesterase
LYTGAPIIPRGMENLPPEYQVKDTTSLTARRIGSTFGISPLIVENAFTTAGAGVGKQTLNILDTLSGVPADQRGGRGVFEDIVESFYRAQGGAEVSKLYDQLKVIDQEKALLNLKIKDAIAKGDIATVQSLSNQVTSQQYAALKRSVEKKELTKNLSAEERAIFKLTDAETQSLLDKNPQLKPVVDKVNQIKDTTSNAINPSFNASNFSFKGSKTKKPKKIKFKKPKVKKFKIPKVKKPKIKKLKAIKI